MAESITPIIQEYTVDFASSNNFLFVKGIQGDGYGTRYVDITLVNNTSPYTIDQDAVRVVIRGTKPDGTAVFNECEILNDNTIRVEITQQMSAVSGKGNYEISIMALETNQTLTSFPFFIMTSQSSFDIGYVVSSDEFGLLVEKINQVDQLDKEVNESIDRAEEAIANAETATENANTATQNAIDATEAMNNLHDTVSAAEEQRIENENKRQEDTATAIANAEEATQNAITAKENADEATTNATNATTEAQKRIDEYDSLNVSDTIQNAITATEEAQERIDEYDSLNVSTTIQNAITATTNAQEATTAAQNATAAAIEATEDAIAAVEAIQEAIGIDDTTEALTTTWSSSHIKEVIEQHDRYRISNITIQTTDWNNKNVYIKSDRINTSSVIDIYYNNSCFEYVEDFDVNYSQGDGWICFTATYDPYESIVIDAIMIENYYNDESGTLSGTLE